MAPGLEKQMQVIGELLRGDSGVCRGTTRCACSERGEGKSLSVVKHTPEPNRPWSILNVGFCPLATGTPIGSVSLPPNAKFASQGVVQGGTNVV